MTLPQRQFEKCLTLPQREFQKLITLLPPPPSILKIGNSPLVSSSVHTIQYYTPPPPPRPQPQTSFITPSHWENTGKIVLKTSYNYCLDNNLLTWRNSGFKPLDSAMNQLLMVTHKIYMALEHGQDVIMVFLDISKAFDRVWHDGLVHKLKTLGISGHLLEWLTNYLKDRLQRVFINGYHPDWTKIPAGVPQGSILGPLLFLIYVNDITLDIHSDIYLYADDTIPSRQYRGYSSHKLRPWYPKLLGTTMGCFFQSH